ncbi:MAG: glycosyltransferase family 1 protein [Bacilli bacterium]|jgi:glycosyltransferase involved in cell wall biosynthesis
MIKILYLVGGPMSLGGIESFIMNNIRLFDTNKFKIDFVIDGFETGVYDQEIIKKGMKIFNVPTRGRHPISNYKQISTIIAKGNYDIVHSHLDAMGVIALRIAKKHKVKVRIAHSHNTRHLTNNILKWFLNEIARFLIRFYATDYVACSSPAGKWMFGKRKIKKGEVKIFPNAIDYEKFVFNEDKRKEIREKYNIEDEFVIGHIGRFDYQKNHKFLIELIKKISNKNNNTLLIMIGDGHLKNKIKLYSKKINVENNVLFIDGVKNIYDYYNIFDIFCLPSHFEGLGIVLVEAQVNGLKCIASNNIPSEVNILDKVDFISNAKLDLWVDKILETRKYDRLVDLLKVEESGYSISKQSKELQNYYDSLVVERA